MNGAPPPAGLRSIEGVIGSVLYQGAVRRIHVEANGFALNAVVGAGGDTLAAGAPVTLAFDPSAMHRMEDAL